MTETNGDTAGRSGRWRRREKRRQTERQRLQKHGAGLRRVYIDAIKKRIADSKKG
jgi:hypothetical protein